MPEPIVTRERIAEMADQAAQRFARGETAAPPDNPFPVGSDAAAAWSASFQRQLLWHTAPDAQGSA